MTRIKCPGCGSDQWLGNDICTLCGYSIASYIEKLDPVGLAYFARPGQKKNSGGCLMPFLIFVVTPVIVLIVFGLNHSTKMDPNSFRYDPEYAREWEEDQKRRAQQRQERDKERQREPVEVRGLNSRGVALVWMLPREQESAMNQMNWQCPDMVRRRLKTPRSAIFPSTPFFATTTDYEIYHLEGFVDAQNLFGAMIRTRFRATGEVVHREEDYEPVVKITDMEFLE